MSAIVKRLCFVLTILTSSTLFTKAGIEIDATSIASPISCGGFGSSDGTPCKYSKSPALVRNSLSILGK